MIWAVKNAGGDKFATVNQLLRQRPTYDDKSETRITLEIEKLKHEALAEGNQEDIHFLEKLSVTLLESFDSYRNWI